MKAHRFGSGRGIIACASIVPRHPEAFARPARKSGNAGRERGGSASTVLKAFFDSPGARYDKVRRAGVAVSLGEFVPELAAVSCPVFSPGRQLIGALSVGGFRSRFTKTAIARFQHGCSPQLERSRIRWTTTVSGREIIAGNRMVVELTVLDCTTELRAAPGQIPLRAGFRQPERWRAGRACRSG